MTSKFSSLKQKNIHDLRASVGQKSGQAQLGCLWPHACWEAAVGALTKSVVLPERSTGGRAASKFTYVGMVGFRFPWVVRVRSWSFMAVGQRSPSVSSHVGFSVGHLTTRQLAFLRATSRESEKQGSHGFVVFFL